MTNTLMIVALLFVSATVSVVASAQEVDELEPQVDTSANLPTEDIGPGVDTSAIASSDTGASNTDGDSASARVSSSSRGTATVDSIELNASQITGNQELPQVLYIVPWKSSDLGDLVGRPVNTLLDEVLAPADREVLQRQIAYYEDLNPDTGGD